MKLIEKNCYILLTQIPEGKITTYKMIADFLGVKSYRYIGKIISKNTNLIDVPCHRVVLSNGKIGGYAGGVDTKRKLLIKEAIIINNDKIQNLKNYIFNDFKL